MDKFTLYLGLNDKDSKIQKINTTQMGQLYSKPKDYINTMMEL